jgi:hypothetical protein
MTSGDSQMEPLLIQHHIPKTAGTSIRQVTRANYKPSEVVGIDWWTKPFSRLVSVEASRVRQPDGTVDWESLTVGRTTMVDAARDYYRSLPHRQRVRCFMGHLAGFLLPVVNDRPVRAACMLRDPVDRVVSLIRWAEWSTAQRGDDRGETSVVVQAMRSRGWTLKDVYHELGGSGALPTELSLPFGRLFNGQARHLLASASDSNDMPFTAGGEDLEAYRGRVLELLQERYVVGAQDRFLQSLRLFADSFGWRHVFVPKARRGPRPEHTERIDDETRALIRAHNTLDSELHAHFSDRLRLSPSVTAPARLRGSVYFRFDGARRALRRRTRGRLRRLLTASRGRP